MTIGSVSSPAVQGSLASAAQESKETPAQTKAEAARGDVQAKRLIARQATQSAAPAAKPADPSGKGSHIDVHA